MKKVLTLVTALVFGALVFTTTESRASHAVAADITYTYVGPNQFLLTLRLYRDCFGIPAPPSASISYTSSCFPGGNITLQPLPGTGQPIPNSPCVPAVITTCNGGSGYGIQEWIYQGVVTLPGPCVDWRFAYNLCCRNDQINTLINPASFNLYVSTTLDNFNFPTNSSPSFSNIPVTQFCIGNQFYYSQGATDIDGDSLVFSLAISETNLNQPVTYAPGYGPLTPLASSTPTVCNPNTGTISFTPSLLQVGVMAVVCEEYRNGVKIGQIKRDMQMKVVSTCIGTAPFVISPVDPNGNPAPYFTASCGDTSVYIVLDQPVQCGSIVTTDIRMLTPQGLPNPVLSATPVNCINGQTDSILVTFFYPLTAGITYAYTKEGFDGNTFLSECGIEVPEFDSLAFNVTDPGVFNTEPVTVSCAFDSFTVSFDYDIICNTLSGNGSEFILVDANGVSYPVTGTSGCNQGSGNFNNIITFNFGQTVAPATPVYLIVQNGTDANAFTNRCNTFILPGDTLAVLNVINNISVDLGSPQTACDNGPFPLLDAGLPGATYSWSVNGSTIPGATSQTISANQNGTYSVVVTYSAACSATDNVNITIVPSPVVTLGNDIEICSTEPFPVLNAGNAGATYQWYQGATAIPGATSQTYQTSAAGTYSVSVTNGGLCSGTDEIIVTVIPSLPVSLASDLTICSYDTYPVLDAGFPGSTYAWSLNGSTVGGNTQTLNTNAAGTYTVLVTSAAGCTGTDDFVLNVVPQLTFDLGEEIFVCLDSEDAPILTAPDITGNNYNWTLSTDPAFTGSTYNVTTAGYGTYSVLITDPNGCTGTDQVDVTELCGLVIPNIFTPGNGDNLNDYFQIGNIESNPNTKVVIVNRWGNEVYSTDNYNNTTNRWDGADLPDGTYFYVVVTQLGEEFKGTVKLLRAEKN
ncbi:MAG: hypothetical protein RL090_1088 [Bacteroidota bacterium]